MATGLTRWRPFHELEDLRGRIDRMFSEMENGETRKWRMALDVCWNNNADAKAYVLKTTNFFAGLANNGIGTIFDVYSTGGQPKSGAAANSASIVGTATIGAMVTAGTNAGHKAFLDRGYQFVMDAAYVPDPTIRMDAYTYYNATVGLLMALTMSGNFQIL